jgi:radical SAM superfamily enzyme YgiQ (UPF0313 family)
LSVIDGILPHVQRPSRYIDGELNLTSRGFDEGGFNVLLVFPDVYEIGMSHQGIRFLYERLSRIDGIGVEFAFSPWPDMEELMRSCGEPFRSWQTRTEARRFDCIGFSLTYELHYTNMLALLELSGLDVNASKRGDEDPVVVAGGPCCSNPLPFVDAVDAVFLGDGEESLVEAVRAMRALGGRSAGRRAMVESLAGIEGVYVDGSTERARYRVHRFEEPDLSRIPIVPSSSIVHDRLSVEIMRGCTRGCRFCHAGIINRPRRERGVREIVDAVCAGLDASGWEEVSLLSLSSSDYSRLDELLEALVPELRRRRVSLAMPSLRPETVTERLVEVSSLMRKSGFTLAPEAGTERLRRVINKGLSEEEILEGCRRIIGGGWQSMKLYFMIGLPTETEEDLDGIVRLVERILVIPGGRFKLSISVSPFVPKPHTPFQWERQASIEELRKKQAYLGSRLRSRRIRLAMREPAISLLEGVMARGGRRLWPVLGLAYRLGCRFDGWRDMLRFDLWERAFAEEGFDIDTLTGGFPAGEELPWAPFEPPVSTAFLLRERSRAFAEEPTPDCREEPCSGCGACDGDEPIGIPSPISVSPFVSKPHTPRGASIAGDEPANADGTSVRYRFVFRKGGRERFLSHLETLGVIQRALRRSGLPLRYTRGFHPHPRLSMGPSLAVGIEGFREFFDAELTDRAAAGAEDFEDLLPAGLGIVDIRGPFSRGDGRLPANARYRYLIEFDLILKLFHGDDTERKGLSGESEVWYRFFEKIAPVVRVPEGFRREPARWLHERLGDCIETGMTVTDRRDRNRSSAGSSVRLSNDGKAVELELRSTQEGTIRPKDMIAAVLHPQLAEFLRYTRTGILYERDEDLIDPIDLIHTI